jgi:hypothetical protein
MSADERPPGVPKGARKVTLAQLKDEIATETGSLRLGPRGSYLRMKMELWPFSLVGTVRAVRGGGISKDHGGRVFSLDYAPGRRKPSKGMIVCFTQPGAAEREMWIWTLDDQRAK